MNAKKCKELRKQLRAAFKLETMHRTAQYDRTLVKNYVQEDYDTGEKKVVYSTYRITLVAMCPRFIYQRAKKVIGHVKNRNKWSRGSSSRLRELHAERGSQAVNGAEEAADIQRSVH